MKKYLFEIEYGFYCVRETRFIVEANSLKEAREKWENKKDCWSEFKEHDHDTYETDEAFNFTDNGFTKELK